MKKKKIRAALLLTLASFIWGSTFVAQRMGGDFLEPLTFTFSRSLLAGIVLFGFLCVKSTIQKTSLKDVFTKETVIGGLCCAAVLFFATTLQQTGVTMTTAGKAGFLTTTYIVIVPLLGLFIKKKPPNVIWLSVLIAIAGLYLLTVKDGLRIELGDILVILCAVCFSGHILVTDHFSRKANPIGLSCIQFLTVGIASLPLAYIFEQPSVANVARAWIPLIYTGILSSSIAFTLQILAQKDLAPAVASIIMSLESVFAVLCGWLVLNETLFLKEGVGCVLMFTAVILAQLPEKAKKNRRVAA